MVERVRESAPVFDIQVADNHNFFANGILVHNCLLVDDPIKNDKEANSPVYRDSVWEWWLNTARTRIEPGGAAVIVMTRWHEDDLVGRLISRMEKGGDGAEHWEVLNLPAIAETGFDALGREPGEALWPERWPIEALNEIRSGVRPLDDAEGLSSEYVWNALYQGNPTGKGSTTFDREWFVNRFDPDDYRLSNLAVARFISWDTALKDKSDSAYTSGSVFELMPDYRVNLREVHRGRWKFPEMMDEITRLAQRWNRDEKLNQVIIEDKASGTSAIQTLQVSAPDWLRGRLVAYEPPGSKTRRAELAAYHCRRDCVRLPQPGPSVPWLFDFEDELFRFPRAAYADQVDSFDQGVNWLENYLAEGARVRGLVGAGV